MSTDKEKRHSRVICYHPADPLNNLRKLTSTGPVFTHQLGERGGSKPSGGESDGGTAICNLRNIIGTTLAAEKWQLCTSMHSKERVESVCHSLPERNSQEAESEKEEHILILFELILICLSYQLFLHTRQSPHSSHFPPVCLFANIIKTPNLIFNQLSSSCLSAASTHTAEVI